MTQSDSFIEEVTEEVKRDKLFKMLKKYGWIGVVVVLGLVGGTAWTEYRKAQYEAQAQATGDAILAALQPSDPAERISALGAVEVDSPGAQAIIAMLLASEEANEGDGAAAAATLRAAAEAPDLPAIYRQIASFKAIAQGGSALPVEERRLQLDVMAQPGNPLRLLAEEQLALLDIETGDRQAAVERLQRIIADAEASAGLRRRASQLMVALGEELDPA